MKSENEKSALDRLSKTSDLKTKQEEQNNDLPSQILKAVEHNERKLCSYEIDDDWPLDIPAYRLIEIVTSRLKQADEIVRVHKVWLYEKEKRRIRLETESNLMAAQAQQEKEELAFFHKWGADPFCEKNS